MNRPYMNVLYVCSACPKVAPLRLKSTLPLIGPCLFRVLIGGGNISPQRFLMLSCNKDSFTQRILVKEKRARMI